jgi:radical SAM superfamily enzyme YgiQ (UPF0313 family)
MAPHHGASCSAWARNYPNEQSGRALAAVSSTVPALVDFYIFKEGELPFVALVRQLQALGFDAAASRASACRSRASSTAPAMIWWRRHRQQRSAISTSFPRRISWACSIAFFSRRDLSPLLQTARGCPFQCTFCVER